MDLNRPSQDEGALPVAMLAVSRRRRRRARWVWLCRLIGVALVGWLGAILFDAVVPLAAGVRTVLVTTGIVGLAVMGWKRWPRSGPADTQTLCEARRVEQHYGLKHNPLVNALWLAPVASRETGTFAAAMAGRSMANAQAALGGVNLDTLVDRIPLRQAMMRMSMAVLVVCGVYLVQPRLVGTGVARWLDPWGDHPPFSFTQFEVIVEPHPVVVGDHAEIRAQLHGNVPSHAALVELDDQTLRETRRWPMARIGPGAFHHRLISLRKPIVFRIEAGSGYSHRYRIKPTSRTPPPVPPNPPQPQHTDMSPQITDTPTATPIPDPLTLTRKILAKLEHLADEAQRLQARADQLASLTQQTHDRPALADDITSALESINQQLSQFTAHGQLLSTNLSSQQPQAAQPAGGSRRFLSDAWSGIAGPFDQLMLPRLTPYDSTGAGSPQSDSGGVGDTHAMQAWLEHLNQAAKQDHQLLNQLIAQVDRALAGAVGVGRGGERAEDQTADVTPRGAAQEQRPAGTLSSDQLEAIIQQAPQAYQEAVAWYFQRLAKEQAEHAQHKP